MRKTLTTRAARMLKPRVKSYVFPDPELRQHYVRVQPSGRKAFVVITYQPGGKQKWATIGDVDILEIAEARQRARIAIGRVHDGLPAVEAPEESFEAVALRWLERHVVAKQLRSEKRIRWILQRHVFHFWKERTFLSIKRSDVAALLDDVEDDHGASQANHVLKYLSSMMNWFATRDDDYRPPIIRGMRRYSMKQHARARTLDDDEIRALWKATESGGAFDGLVRIALLTAQRRTKCATIRWDDISDEGIWTIRTEPREKGNAGSLVLPKLALDIIRAQPRLWYNPHVFAGRGDGPSSAWGLFKHRLDVRLPEGFKPWVIHDLRRTARSLMSRAGVAPDVAERVLGHAIVGVAGVYNRYEYRDEKADALARLANLIGGIVDPQPNVLPLAKQKRVR